MSVQLVCFDLGRVLIRICDGWADALTLAGLPAVDLAGYPKETRTALSSAVHQVERGEITPEAFAHACAPLLGIPAAHVEAVLDAYVRGPYPGVPDLLDALQARGLPTACLSNTNARHWELMSDPARETGLPLGRLTYRFGSHLLGARKPDESVYAAVEDGTGMGGEAIAFFDDLPDNVEAAQRRGWRACLVAHPGDPVAQMRAQLIAWGVLDR